MEGEGSDRRTVEESGQQNWKAVSYTHLMDEEGMQDTPNKLIHIGKPIEFDEDEFQKQLDELYEIANRDSENIKEAVQRIVPTYVIKRDEK